MPPGRRPGRARCCVPDWQEPIGAGERRIPAVRAPDGTLIYLVQPDADGRSFWEDDFELLPAPGEATALLGIDHVVLALPAGRMASHVLFWRALFGLVPQPQLDTADPYGLVHSRALVSPDGRLRIVLERIGRPRNADRTFRVGLRRRRRAPYRARHHRTSCERRHGPRSPACAVAADARQLLRRPVGTLGAGRRDAARSCKAHGLLYDRDDAGEFRHLYTDAFHDRFFFEAVQRQAGYAGFGAANASVRTAAQARRRKLKLPTARRRKRCRRRAAKL